MTTCPKCHAVSGDDWKQCGGSCPMPMSPHFSGLERSLANLASPEDKRTRRVIDLINGALNSLRYAAPENAHLFYERFAEAAKILEDSLAEPMEKK